MNLTTKFKAISTGLLLASTVSLLPNIAEAAPNQLRSATRQFKFLNYNYRLIQSSAWGPGDPLRIKVRDGKVIGAYFLTETPEHKIGELNPNQGDWLSIQKVLRTARSSATYAHQITWPAKRLAPTQIFIDPSGEISDEETMYYLDRLRLIRS